MADADNAEFRTVSRWGFLHAVLWRRGVAVVSGVYGLVGVLDFVDGKLIPRLTPAYQDTWNSFYVLPSMQWRTWLAVGLGLLVAIVMEGAYRFIVSRDSVWREKTASLALAAKAVVTSDQVLALKVQQLESRLADAQRTAAERIYQDDWKQLADAFRALPGFEVAAPWQKNTEAISGISQESWGYLRGSPTDSKECETLCRQAGTMLLKSPNVAGQLSGMVHYYTEPAHRWYQYLKDQYGLSDVGHGIGTNDDVEVETIFFGSIDELKAKSARACIDCATIEMAGSNG